MPLPEKVIEELGRETPQVPGWSSQLLMFSGTIFLISWLIYFGIAYGYTSYLQSRAKNLNDQIQVFAQQVPVGEQAKIIDFYSQIVNLKQLLGQHVYISSFFGWLEKNTDPNVYFTSLNLSAVDNSAGLSGVARTIVDMNQELLDLSTQPEVVKVTVGSVAYANGLWQFNATVFFNTALLHNLPVSPS